MYFTLECRIRMHWTTEQRKSWANSLSQWEIYLSSLARCGSATECDWTVTTAAFVKLAFDSILNGSNQMKFSNIFFVSAPADVWLFLLFAMHAPIKFRTIFPQLFASIIRRMFFSLPTLIYFFPLLVVHGRGAAETKRKLVREKWALDLLWRALTIDETDFANFRYLRNELYGARGTICAKNGGKNPSQHKIIATTPSFPFSSTKSGLSVLGRGKFTREKKIVIRGTFE